MPKWDQDIHRIQEIQQLLQDRQRYFCGQLSTSCYKLDSNGNPLFFPKLHSTFKSTDSNEPSLGRSVQANVGSTDTGSNEPPLNTSLQEEDEEEKHGESGVLSDSSDGHCADQSQNESSDASDVNGKDATKKKVKRKNPKVLRKWVTKNLETVSAPSLHRKSNGSSNANVDSRKSSILRFKSVSFDGELAVEVHTEKKNELDYEDLLKMPIPARLSKKKKVLNPIKMLRRRSWILKAEMATRLNEDTNSLNLNKVMPGLSKSSISHAREKLKKAERSLRATVKNEHKIPMFKKPNVPAPIESKNQIIPSIPKFSLANKPTVSRLAIRQQEESLRSDLNLREAFAMIKIDPNPLLKLASVENDSRQGKKTASGAEREAVAKQRSDEQRKSLVMDDESKTAQSLQRLTKLSIQHLQRKQSWIASSVQPHQIQTGNKEMERKLKNMVGSSGKPQQGNADFPKPFDPSRRKSSVASTTGSIQQNKHSKKRSKELIRERTSKLPSSGMATNYGDRKRFQERNGDFHVKTLDRLVGTVI